MNRAPQRANTRQIEHFHLNSISIEHLWGINKYIQLKGVKERFAIFSFLLIELRFISNALSVKTGTARKEDT